MKKRIVLCFYWSNIQHLNSYGEKEKYIQNSKKKKKGTKVSIKFE